MDLLAISLTGADDSVDPSELLKISQQFPLVEWAILSTPKAQGSARYPTEEWVSAFHKACPHVRKAIHLCGSDVQSFLDEDPRVLAKVAKFDRVQLNFNQRRQPKDLDTLVRVANKVKTPVILQYNEANKDLWSELHTRIVNLAFLFDSSGGGGRSPKDGWPAMLPRTVCGFAGGLGPENVKAEFEKILKIAGGRRFWIDMEGKLRSRVDDSFDRHACVSVLEQVHPRRWAA